MKFLPKLKKLNHSGIAHFVLPLLIVVAVGAVGTYMVVGSHANGVRKHGITVSHTSKAKSTPKKGILVLFTQGGIYDRDEIRVIGTSSKGLTCGTAFGADGTAVVQGFKKYNPKDSKTWAKAVPCSAIGGTAFYNVKFGYKNDNGSTVVNNPGVNVDVDAGYCTFVHADGTSTKVPNDGKGCNGPFDPAQKPAPWTPSMSVRGLRYSNKSIVGYVDVAGTPDGTPGANIKASQKYRCSGSVNLVATNGKKTINSTRPLKYTQNKAFHGGNGYCVATISTRLSSSTGDWAGTWTLTATLKSNPDSYFADGSASGTVTIATVGNTGGVKAPN